MTLQENGVNVKALNNRPGLLPGLEFYFNAYIQLRYDKQIGFTTGPIPWSSVIKWCNLHNIYDINDIEVVLRYIRALENAEFAFDQKDK